MELTKSLMNFAHHAVKSIQSDISRIIAFTNYCYEIESKPYAMLAGQ
jgi:hypothetical protein